MKERDTTPVVNETQSTRRTYNLGWASKAKNTKYEQQFVKFSYEDTLVSFAVTNLYLSVKLLLAI